MEEFVIDREKWARGERYSDKTFKAYDREIRQRIKNYLLGEDGKQCCLGLYLSECGVTDKTLQGLSTPREVHPSIPESAAWLVIENGERYTETTTKDIAKKRNVLVAPFSESMADTAPLRALIERKISTATIDAIAVAHRRGRRLFIGTANLDAG